jgi:hypothetical protein
VSVTIGLLVNDELKKKVSFWNDANITSRQVSSTCERCPLTDCQERVAQPHVLRENERLDKKEEALRNLHKRLEEKEAVE